MRRAARIACILHLSGGLALSACEIIAGYDDVEPRSPDASVDAPAQEAAPLIDTSAPDVSLFDASEGDAPDADLDADARTASDARPDAIADARADAIADAHEGG